MLPQEVATFLRLKLHRGSWLNSDWNAGTSAITHFAALTGGVYKRRERIHRGLLIRDYYQFLVHEAELQASIPTERPFDEISSTLPFRDSLSVPL